MVTQNIKRALLKYIPFAPAIFLAVLIPQYWVDVPQYDEWDSVTLFEHLSQGSLTVGLLFKQVNEYRQFFPNLIFVELGRLTHWDLRYEMILIFVAACLISLNIRRLAVLTTQATQVQFAILLLVANLIIFSLTQYENWFQAQQLVYYMPILCVTTCVIVAKTNLKTLAKFVVCAPLATISMFSSANGVVCWIVILPMLLFSEWRKDFRLVKALAICWIAALAGSIALYLYGFQKPWWTPSPSTALYSPFRALIYFFGFVGGPLGLERVNLSIVAGMVSSIGFVLACLYVWKHRADRSLVDRTIGWLVIGGYSVLTAGMTTVGRVGLPTGPSQVPRYLGFSVYLLLALVFLANIIGDDLSRRRGKSRARLHPISVVIIVVLILYQPFMFALSFRKMDAWETRLLQAKASILLINQLPDTRLTKILYPNVQFLIEKANALDRLGLLRPKLIATKHVREFSATPPIGRDMGSMQPVQKSGDNYSVSGWAILPEQQRSPDAIILAYDTGDNDPIAFAMTHPVKDSWFGSASSTGQWQVLFSPEQLPKSSATITAWAFDAKSGKAFKLAGESRIDH